VVVAEERGAQLESDLLDARDRIKELEDGRDRQQIEVNRLHRSHMDLSTQLKTLRASMEHTAERQRKLQLDGEEADGEIQRATETIAAARSRLEVGMDEMAALEAQRAELESGREQGRTRLGGLRLAAQNARQAAQELALKVESKRSAQVSVTQGLERLRNQLEQLAVRRDELQAQLDQSEEPLASLTQELDVQLRSRREVEETLAAARRLLESTEVEMRELMERHGTVEAAVDEARASLEAARLAAQ
jgi:chromosome segregation protein